MASITLDSRQAAAVAAAICEILQHGSVGSETDKVLLDVERRIYFSDYCERHGIAYEDLTDEDAEQAYWEKYEE